jgi:hypothetical protein
MYISLIIIPYKFIHRLLNACPSAATLVVHQLCQRKDGECLRYLRLLNSVQVGIFEQLDDYAANHFLPVHYAAKHSTVDVLEYLLHEYPESLHMTILKGDNLLHLCLSDSSGSNRCGMFWLFIVISVSIFLLFVC